MWTRRFRTIALAAAPLGAFAVLSASCVQVLGLAEVPPGDPHDGQCGAVVYADVDCGHCMDGSCCAEADACAADPACASRFACRSRCAPSDAACRIACGVSPALPASAEGLLDACRRQKCGMQCLGCSDYGDVLGADCAACVARSCCDQVDACASQPGCDAAVACGASCMDPGCIELCPSLDAGSIETAIALVGCLKLCEDDCKIGQRWSCVGTFTPPVLTGATYPFLVTDALGSPLDGVVVQACDASDPTCSQSHLAQATTTTNGVAVLTVPFEGAFSGTFVVEDPQHVYVPALLSTHLMHRVTMYTPAEGKAAAMLPMVNDTFDLAKDVAVSFDVLDCQDQEAPGVTFQLGPQAYAGLPVHYVSYSMASLTETDSTGTVLVIVHTPDGVLSDPFLIVSAYHAGQLVGKKAILLRVGYLSYGSVGP